MQRYIPSNSAEEVLLERELIHRRSRERQQIIGCIGCRWLEAEATGEQPETYGYEIRQCTERGQGGVHTTLNELVKIGAVQVYRQDVSENPNTPLRNLIRPSETEVGIAFHEQLTLPENCPLKS